MSEIDTSDEAVERDAAMCAAASYDDRLADGMLYRRAAEKLRALLRERNEAREYAIELRLREKALDDARVSAVDKLARPDIAAILRGEAVAVPKEAIDEMYAAAADWSREKHGKPIGNDALRGCYAAMLAASPYNKGDEIGSVVNWRPFDTVPDGEHVLLYFPVGERGLPAIEAGMVFRGEDGSPPDRHWSHGGPNSGTDWVWKGSVEPPTMWRYHPAMPEEPKS